MEFGIIKPGLPVRQPEAAEHPGARRGDYPCGVPPEAIRRVPLLVEQWLHLPVRPAHLVRVQKLRLKD